MTVRIIGAGFGRTGTHSLKVALERLVGGTCHHMVEVFANPEQVGVWADAGRGTMPDWREFLEPYSAIVDWPGAAYWPELAAAFPDAPVVLSSRDPDSWWRSANDTIFVGLRSGLTSEDEAWRAMVAAMFARHGIFDIGDREQCIAAFTANLDKARAEISPDRLVEWTATDGWGPLCRALELDEPDEPFPVTNTTAEFRQMLGLDGV